MVTSDLVADSLATDQRFLLTKMVDFQALKANDDFHGFCTVALQTLEALKDHTCERHAILKHQHEQLEQEFLTVSTTHIETTTQLKQMTTEKATQEAKLAGQALQIKRLHDSILREQEAMDLCRGRIHHEEQRRSNAVYDLIPFHGIMSSIISGDAKRAIPLYSQVDGIVSAVEQELEATETRLRRAHTDRQHLEEQRNDTRRTIEEIRATIARLKDQVRQAKAQINECDQKLKATGRAITQLSQVNDRLCAIHDKLTLTNNDVELVRDIDEPASMNDCIHEFTEICQMLAQED